MHKDIGKRVKWRLDDKEGYGELVAVLNLGDRRPYLVQQEDGTRLSVWADSYELTEPMNEFTYAKVGDLVKTANGDLLRILDIRGEGELRLFDLSVIDNDKNSEDLKRWGTMHTEWQMLDYQFTLVKDEPEEPVTELTLDEIAQKFGVPVSQLKIKKD